MRSRPSSWNTLLAKLGLKRKHRHSQSNKASHKKLRFEQCEDRCMLAAFTVTSNLDNTIGGDGLLTLREAVDAANQFPDADTITFDSSLSGETITLTEGQLTITKPVLISGGLNPDITIDASGNDPTSDSTPFDMDPLNDGDGSRVFDIDLQYSYSAEEVRLDGLTITGGDSNATEGGGGIRFQGSTSSAAGDPKLIISNSTIEGNYALAV